MGWLQQVDAYIAERQNLPYNSRNFADVHGGDVPPGQGRHIPIPGPIQTVYSVSTQMCYSALRLDPVIKLDNTTISLDLLTHMNCSTTTVHCAQQIPLTIPVETHITATCDNIADSAYD